MEELRLGLLQTQERVVLFNRPQLLMDFVRLAFTQRLERTDTFIWVLMLVLALIHTKFLTYKMALSRLAQKAVLKA